MAVDEQVRRETPEETQERLARDTPPLSEVINPGASGKDNMKVPVQRREPLPPVPIDLPVAETAQERVIVSKGDAVAHALRHDGARRKIGIGQRIAQLKAGRRALTEQRKDAEQERKRREDARAGYAERVPSDMRRRLGLQISLAVRVLPFAALVADILFMARAYGLLGSPTAPFTHGSPDVSSVFSWLRAGAVGLVVVFGTRLVGGRFRLVIDEVRAHNPERGRLVDLAVVGVAVAGLGPFAWATAKMQNVVVELTTGGTTTGLSAGVLVAIYVALILFSFAAGYFLSEPEHEMTRRHDTLVSEARALVLDLRKAELATHGEIVALYLELRALPGLLEHRLAEEQAHTESAVWELKAKNVALYGLDTSIHHPSQAAPS